MSTSTHRSEAPSFRPQLGLQLEYADFNTLNSFTQKGDAPPRMEMCFDGLMVRALDEPDAVYGQIADGVTISDDRNSFEFSLRPEAHFHDGTPLEAQDAAFTFKLFKDKGHPTFRVADALQDAVASITHLGSPFPASNPPVRCPTSSAPGAVEGFHTASPFDSSQLNPMLSSSAYKVGRSRPAHGSNTTAADYWGRDLVNRPEIISTASNRVLLRTHGCRGLEEISYRGVPRVSGPPPMTPRIHSRQGDQARIPSRKAATMQGSGQSAARTVS